MDLSKSLDEKIKIDNNLSNRHIDLDPNGYFIIKVDLEENKINPSLNEVNKQTEKEIEYENNSIPFK